MFSYKFCLLLSDSRHGIGGISDFYRPQPKASEIHESFAENLIFMTAAAAEENWEYFVNYNAATIFHFP